MKPTLPILAALFLALPAAALAEKHGSDCSESMLAAVRQQMPRTLSALDPAALSCNGLAQVYFIMTDPEYATDGGRSRAIAAVFRREGLGG
ncbi:hypothetical protein HKCCE3408_00025 [Rhodobacterales bacterium HKCCE3408]|nr:hypothetical protein [Rhodobacterales bacterium HKCCE3408]